MPNLDAPRYLEKFTNLAGTVSYTFPVKAYQLDSTQAVRNAIQEVIGADYAVDLLGFQPAPKAPGGHAHRAYFTGSPGTGGATIDAAVDDADHKLYTIGLGKLYIVDSAGVERWAYARLVAMPQTTWKAGDLDFMAVSLDWSRLSDWYSVTQYSQDFVLGSSDVTLTVTNTGTARVFNSIMILKGTYSNESIVNNTNGYGVNSSQVGAAATDWLKIDAGQGSVTFSADGGSNYSGVYSTVSLATHQVHLMVLEPGDNSIRVRNASGATFHVEFYPGYD